MLHRVEVGKQSLRRYAASAGEETIEALHEAARELRGLRVLHLNATPYGGGVAEILRSEIPLLRDLGIQADWQLISGDEVFFRVTKALHNALQGDARGLSETERETYLAHSTRNARLLDGTYDVVMVHDPQPLALHAMHGAGHSPNWIWRCHIDTSQPNAEVWEFLRPFLGDYRAAVFTMADFVPPDIPVPRVEVIPPAIDPESPKNFPLPAQLQRRVLQWIGVDPDLPLIVQVSRFDRWKDPLGVIAAYRLVKQEIPDLHLALVGSMALDDPEGLDVYAQVQAEAEHDDSLLVFTNLTGIGNIEVNAFQRRAQVVIQKSLREGFGLVVSEALWKQTPVVAGRAGGIPTQMPDGTGGFLVDSVAECAERVLWLLRNPDEARALGAAGHDHVRRRFLLPRLLADELALYRSVVTTSDVGPAGVPKP